MKIGITYDLRDDYLQQGYSEEETAEFDSIETVEAIEAALKKQGFAVERIGNVRQLAAALVNGQRWDLVFNIAEGLHGIGREAQVPALLDAYQIPYTFSDTVTLALTLDKSLAKRIVRDHGIATAPFVVITHEKDLDDFSLKFPVFAKPIAEGTGKGITAASRADSLVALKEVCRDLLQRYQQPVLVETFLSGREFTVGMFGSGDRTETAGVMEIILNDNAEPGAYSFFNKEHYEGRIEYRMVDDAEALQAADTARRAWQALRCQDGGRIDIRSDAAGVPHFLEVNPIAGLHPVRSDLFMLLRFQGFSYDDFLRRIMQETLQRLKLC
jgi:D-alanine-D-alanine ligase